MLLTEAIGLAIMLLLLAAALTSIVLIARQPIQLPESNAPPDSITRWMLQSWQQALTDIHKTNRISTLRERQARRK